MPRVLLILLALLCALPSLAQHRWVGYKMPGAVIYVRQGQQDVAQAIGAMTRDALPRLAEEVGVETPGPFPIFAYTDRVAFMRAAGRSPFLLGVSYPSTGLIRIDAGGHPEVVRRTLAHELTHSLLAQRLQYQIGSLPLWVNEGIAGHLSDPITRDQLPGVSRSVHRNGPLTPEEMELAFKMGSDTRDAAYLQSRSMIAWLEYHRPGALSDLLDDMAAGASFPMALRHTTGLTPDTWYREWRQDIPAFLAWLALLGSPVIYAPLAVLCALLAILRLRQKHADAEESDEEEDDADAGDENSIEKDIDGEEEPPETPRTE